MPDQKSQASQPTARRASESVASARRRADLVARKLRVGIDQLRAGQHGHEAARVKLEALRAAFDEAVTLMDGIRSELEISASNRPNDLRQSATARLLREEAQRLHQTKMNFVRAWSIFQNACEGRAASSSLKSNEPEEL